MKSFLPKPSVALTLDTDGLLYSVREELEEAGLDLGVQSCGNQLGLGDPVPSPFPDREFDRRAGCQLPLEVYGPGSAQALNDENVARGEMVCCPDWFIPTLLNRAEATCSGILRSLIRDRR